MAETPSAAFARRFFEGTQKLIAHHLKKRDDRLATLEKRLAEFEARPVLRYAGIWREGGSYAPGDLVTHAGTLWACRAATAARPGSTDAWQLMVKSR